MAFGRPGALASAVTGTVAAASATATTAERSNVFVIMSLTSLGGGGIAAPAVVKVPARA
jgi:hypothetical protein